MLNNIYFVVHLTCNSCVFVCYVDYLRTLLPPSKVTYCNYVQRNNYYRIFRRQFSMIFETNANEYNYFNNSKYYNHRDVGSDSVGVIIYKNNKCSFTFTQIRPASFCLLLCGRYVMFMFIFIYVYKQTFSFVLNNFYHLK